MNKKYVLDFSSWLAENKSVSGFRLNEAEESGTSNILTKYGLLKTANPYESFESTKNFFETFTIGELKKVQPEFQADIIEAYIRFNAVVGDNSLWNEYANIHVGRPKGDKEPFLLYTHYNVSKPIEKQIPFFKIDLYSSNTKDTDKISELEVELTEYGSGGKDYDSRTLEVAVGVINGVREIDFIGGNWYRVEGLKTADASQMKKNYESQKDVVFPSPGTKFYDNLMATVEKNPVKVKELTPSESLLASLPTVKKLYDVANKNKSGKPVK